MEFVRIKHGEHEIEIRGDQDFIQGQLEQFYISIENHEKMVSTIRCTNYFRERRDDDEKVEKEKSTNG